MFKWTLCLVLLCSGCIVVKDGGYFIGRPVPASQVPQHDDGKHVAVLFTNVLCPPCRALEHLCRVDYDMQKSIQETFDYVYAVPVNLRPDLANKAKIESTPTVVYYIVKNNEYVEQRRIVGFGGKQESLAWMNSIKESRK